MPKSMLINATRPSEVRAAILENGKLDQLEIEVRDARLKKGNIYLARIANVEGSLNACFVEFGAEKQGFLPVDEIHPTAYHREWKGDGKPPIQDIVKKGQQILVQVVKDAIGNKGAALTTRISLAGRYIVLMPLDENRGVSRKVSSDSQRKKLKELASKLKIPADYGFIVRTAGLDRTKTELNRDAAQLVRTWKDVCRSAKSKRAPQLLHEDGDLVVRMLRDYYGAEITQVIIDQSDAYERALRYFHQVMPRNKKVLTQYQDRVPLFTRYRVEAQVEGIFGRRADLPSGGYVLIDPTEALISIDVNSGRSTRQKSQEETALHTNMEAAVEIARQLRLRDLGGLIVIDFIDMSTRKGNRAVEKALKDALKVDKARTYIGKISDNGLMEVNRQRLKQALQLQTHRECPTCTGRGIIPSPDFVANRLIRSIESKAANGTFAKATVSLHPELADHLQNIHRRDIVDLEERFGVVISIEGRPGLHRGQQEVDYMGLGGLPDHERKWVEERRRVLEEERLGLKPPPEPPELHDEDYEDDEEIKAMLADDDDDEEEGATDDQPRKRKRRRRRKRRKPGAAGEESADDTADDAADDAADGGEDDDEDDGDDGDDSSEDGDEEDGEGLSRSQKRRLRRKRKRRPTDGDESDETGEQAGDEAGDDGAAGETEEGDRPARRRRRRRRRGARSGGEGGETPTPEQTEAPAEVPTGPPPGQTLIAPPAGGIFDDIEEIAAVSVQTEDVGANLLDLDDLVIEADPFEESTADEPVIAGDLMDDDVDDESADDEAADESADVGAPGDELEPAISGTDSAPADSADALVPEVAAQAPRATEATVAPRKTPTPVAAAAKAPKRAAPANGEVVSTEEPPAAPDAVIDELAPVPAGLSPDEAPGDDDSEDSGAAEPTSAS